MDEKTNASWLGYHVRFAQPSAQEVEWWLDILLADTIVRECLDALGSDLELWRIHRRAGGEAGHQFSLYCYCQPETQKLLLTKIERHPVLVLLDGSGLLRSKFLSNKGSEIEATSDKNWSKPIQQSWPHFIMGVSAMLLDLLDRLRPSSQPIIGQAPLADIKAYYLALLETVNATWQNEGGHAFLHHINAVFGYVPVSLSPRYVAGMFAIL